MIEPSAGDKSKIDPLFRIDFSDLNKMMNLSAINIVEPTLTSHRIIMEQQFFQLQKILNSSLLINNQLVTKIIEEQTERLNLVVRSLTQSILPTLEILKTIDFEGFDEYYEEFGWIESISFAYANKLQKMLKEQGHDEVWNQLLLDISDERWIKSLRENISKSSILAKRERIFFRALEHHQNKDYISSIPLLLAQIEGTVWDIGAKMKVIEDKPNSRVKLDEFGNPKLVQKGTGVGKPQETNLGELLTVIFEKESKFKDHAEHKVYSDEFRHPVLHGREINYGDEKRSAMLIIMLHVLIDKIQEDVK